MKKFVVLSVSIFITAVCSSVVLSYGFTKILHSDRTVTVRGLYEQEVNADTATWKLTFTLGADSLKELSSKIESDTGIAKSFLMDNGLTPDDFTVLAPEITDTTVNVYMDQNKAHYSYIAKQSLLVRSDKVSNVKKCSINTLSLLNKGVSVYSDYGSNVDYQFTKLNDIKPQMIKYATQNAHKAAEQFANDTGCKVGKIKNATQGLFTIEDAAVGLEDIKKVRVVTTVVYTITD